MFFALANIILFLQPFTPHLSEEIWQKFGNKNMISTGYEFPKANRNLNIIEDIKFVIQINGKFKFTLPIAPGLKASELEKIILENERISSLVKGKEIIKKIIIPNKLINLVVK